jgi:hypothetical protein
MFQSLWTIVRYINTYLKHKYVCKLNITNLRANKFYNLVLNFVALIGECL